MTEVGCLPAKLDDEVKETVMETDDGPPSKKLKQGRLPFKPLDHAGHVRPNNTPPGSKKRKLSDNESPSAKQLRTGGTTNVGKTLVLDGEHEVSSSSEAEVTKETLDKQVRKLSTIDKFFRPKPVVADQEEISSTNEVIEVDLTNDDDSEKSKQVTKDVAITLKRVDAENCDKENKKGAKPKSKGKDSKKDANSDDKDGKNDPKACDTDSMTADVSSCDSDSKTAEADTVDVDTEGDDSNQSEDDNDSSLNTSQTEDKENLSSADSFIENTSVCEDALKTPAKGSANDSLLLTPVTSSSVGASQGSVSDSTPVSGQKKRSALSESKRKEREALRQKAKEEKEKQREEQRLQKEREKEEKKKELQEKKKQKEEQKEKERLEKEKLKQEEKEKKEKERLEKLKQKEEQKKLKEKELESKNEEKRKKEEERKQKEEEKRQKEEEKRREEEEKQRKEDKKKEMFKGFFIQKEPTVSPPKVKEIKNGLFMPFELKPNMKLAPSRRNPLSEEGRQFVDESLETQDCEKLYLNTVKTTTLGKSFKTWPKTLDLDTDIEILSHEKETIDRVTYRAKFLQFHENTRPAYYGTWRKKSKTLTARNPFKQDEDLFDYEVDSDDEWEEEEPGESVSSDEEDEDGDKEGDKGDDDDEVDDWMVPHGYLSDGEGVDDDEEVDTASKQDLQKVRQAAWESELKRQAKPLKMLAIGCAWENDKTTTIAAQQLQTLLKYKAVCLMDGPISTSFNITRTCDTNSTNDKTEEKTIKSNKKSVPEEAMPDLIRLVHGSPVGIKNLMKEFRMYWKKKTNPDLDSTADETLDSSKLDMSMEVDNEKSGSPKAVSSTTSGSGTPSNTTPKPGAADTALPFSKRQLEIKIMAIASYEKRAEIRKVKCWYVKEEVLQQYNMKDIQLPNSWEYVCIKPPSSTWGIEKVVTPKPEAPSKVSEVKPGPDASIPKIMKFAQPMSPSMIQALGPAIGSKDKPSAGAGSSQGPVQGSSAGQLPGDQTQPDSPSVTKLVATPDQKRIKDMFSPVSATGKSPSNPKAKASPKNTVLKSMLFSNVNKNASPSSSKSPANTETKPNEMNPPTASTSTESNPIATIVNEITPKKGSAQPMSDSENKPNKGTPKGSNKNVLKTLMSSPELLKASTEDSKTVDETANKEQPMDVDIIVLD